VRCLVAVLVFWPALSLAAETAGSVWSGMTQIDLRHGPAPLGSNAPSYELNARRVRLSLKSPLTGAVGY